jgi:hypothetical protein
LCETLFAPEFGAYARKAAEWKRETSEEGAVLAKEVHGAHLACRESKARIGTALPEEKSAAENEHWRAIRVSNALTWRLQVQHVHPSPSMFAADASSRIRGWGRLAALARERFSQFWPEPDAGGQFGPMLVNNAAEYVAIRCLEMIFLVCGRRATHAITSTKNGDFDCLLKAVAYWYALGEDNDKEHKPDEFSGVREKIVTWREQVLAGDQKGLGIEPW